MGAIVVQQPRCPTTQHLHWTGPALGSIKVNSIASYLEETGEYSAGAVARDSRGHVVISICQNTSPSRSVGEAEEKATLIWLHALSRIYRSPVILELDCQIRIKELRTGKQSLSPYYGLLRDIKQAPTNFSDHSISSVGRLCNALADGIGTLARNSEDQERIADVPDCLTRL